MTDERTPLDDLAGRVSDGRPVNWEIESSQVGDDDLALDVEQLRIIAGIADLHRQLAHASQLDTKEASVAENVLAIAPPRSKDGPRFGPLVIQQQLGSGSFGDVYRAWDTTLDREVALKVLRSRAKGSRADSIVREGQMLAKVSHENVMRIFGAQEVDGRVGIWGEFLHGRTLARIIAEDGPLSDAEALVIGAAIARALAAAHRVGVLHRDVKAQNVMREKGGRIVLMDFGLGREFAPGEDIRGTELAGTPLYLAPELFDNGRASPQSDLYSLGVLLFFLVTGTFPVRGASLEKIGDAHRKGERSRLQDLRPDLPAGFVQVVERALEPDPARRYESAGAMQAALIAATQPLVTDRPEPDGVRRWMAVISTIVVGVVASAVTWFVLTRPGPPGATGTFRIEPPPGTTLPDSSRSSPVISPDGKYLAFAATSADGIHLWLHDLSTGEARMVEASDKAATPFWAPDSQTVGFFEPSGTIRTVGVAPGAKPAVVGTASSEPRGATWNRRGLLLMSQQDQIVSARTTGDERGADEKIVAKPDKSRGEMAYMWPQFLADGERFIYFVFSHKAEVRGIYLSSLDGRTRKMLARSDTSGIIRGNSIAFVQQGNLVSLAMDWASGTAIGSPTLLQRNVGSSFDYQSLASFADDGTMAYLPAVETSELIWFSRDGTQQGKLPLPAGRYRSPAISRDGKLLAVQQYQDTISSILIYSLATGQKHEIADSPAVEAAVWASGHNLIYTSIEKGRSEIFMRDVDSDRPPVSLTEDDEHSKLPMDFSETHQLLTFLRLDGEYKMWTLPLANPKNAAPWSPGEGTEVGGRLSPDGKRIFYARVAKTGQSGQTAERVLWVSDFPVFGNQFRVNTGGTDPAWPSNSEVSFFDRVDRFVIADARRSATGEVPAKLSFLPNVRTPSASRVNYAWMPGGDRVLVNVPVTPLDAIRIVVTVPRRSAGR